MLYQVTISMYMVFGIANGTFSFDPIPPNLNNEVFCDGTTNLIWKFSTDEAVTVIEWYKQPGVLIARIFGVDIGTFLAFPPYDRFPYAVRRYKSYTYNTAIRITGMSRDDSGVYSVNVTAAAPQSATLTRKFANPLLVTDEPTIVDISTFKVCFPPPNAVGVSRVWMDSNDNVIAKHPNGIVSLNDSGTYKCCLTGGNAACSVEHVCRETIVYPTIVTSTSTNREDRSPKVEGTSPKVESTTLKVGSAPPEVGGTTPEVGSTSPEVIGGATAGALALLLIIASLAIILSRKYRKQKQGAFRQAVPMPMITPAHYEALS